MLRRWRRLRRGGLGWNCDRMDARGGCGRRRRRWGWSLGAGRRSGRRLAEPSREVGNRLDVVESGDLDRPSRLV